METDHYETLPTIERDRLIDRMMGSVSMAERMVQRFLETCDGESDVLESCIRIGDRAETGSLAHRHKGTARTLSAPKVAECASRLEQRADTGPTSELLGLLGQLREAHRELREAVSPGFFVDTEHASRPISDVVQP